MNKELQEIYQKSGLSITDYITKNESKKYDACRFKLNKFYIISRTAYKTPKKDGLFVTFWKRNLASKIEPINQNDKFDFYIVNVVKNKLLAQFIFPKQVLIQEGIVSTNEKEGKRAFRVYPKWDTPQNKQAKKTQSWQLKYFHQISDNTSLDEIFTSPPKLIHSTQKEH